MLSTISLTVIILICVFCLLVMWSLFKTAGDSDKQLRRWIRDHFNDQ